MKPNREIIGMLNTVAGQGLLGIAVGAAGGRNTPGPSVTTVCEVCLNLNLVPEAKVYRFLRRAMRTEPHLAIAPYFR